MNRGEDPFAVLDAIPLEALAYVHVAGGVERGGVWHDTHAHPVPAVVLDILAELRKRVEPAGVLLERDDDFPAEAELAGELAAIRGVVGPAGLSPARPSASPDSVREEPPRWAPPRTPRLARRPGRSGPG